MICILKLPGYPVLYPNNLVDEIEPYGTYSPSHFSERVSKSTEFDDSSSGNWPARPVPNRKYPMT